MGKRHPLYRLQASDVVEVDFTFAPEYDQTISVQPDGFITLRGTQDLYAAGLTLAELRQKICQSYAGLLHEPEVSIVLKDFERPYFVASGQVVRPGKYELHGDATVTEALAMAGGFTEAAKHSEVILFRRVSGDRVETRVLNVKEMLNARNLAEDVRLRAGDMLWVPQNRISKIRRYLPISSLSLYLNPTQF
ncbi:MAG TPA: polysaccharide biosynthesis/export family protein [Terriglobales bacterium]|nr:polysaccharide biosynthesis/export family protein [Terriglobales bacterium]